MEFLEENNFMSSAYNRVLNCSSAVISLIKMRKNKSPRIELGETPDPAVI